MLNIVLHVLSVLPYFSERLKCYRKNTIRIQGLKRIRPVKPSAILKMGKCCKIIQEYKDQTMLYTCMKKKHVYRIIFSSNEEVQKRVQYGKSAVLTLDNCKLLESL